METIIETLSKQMITGGIWPVALTPFNEDKKIDWRGTEKLIEWYIQNNVSGIFSCCSSSEVFQLTRKEKFELAHFFVKTVAGRIPVMTGVVGYENSIDILDVIYSFQDIGIDRLVLNVAELAQCGDEEAVWGRNFENILAKIDGIEIGLYECPFPYHRLLTPQTIRWIVGMERCVFFKDTSCNIDSLKLKINAVKDSGLKYFNAHTPTFLDSLLLGVHGFCGVGTNYCPDLYGWLYKNFEIYPEKAKKVQDILTQVNDIEEYKYPISAKAFLSLTTDVDIQSVCRVRKDYLSQLEQKRLLDLARQLYLLRKEL